MVKPEELPPCLDGSLSDHIRREQLELEKKRVLVRDQRTGFRQMLVKDARSDDLWGRLEEAIQKIPPITHTLSQEQTDTATEECSIVALLSDIHYGIAFDGYYGKYNPAIAAERVMKYAKRIVDLQKETGVIHCVVGLLGDMVSGTIHQTIRIENRENLIQQIVGVSELTASFLRELAQVFHHIDVYSIGGNHSRIDLSAEDSLRAERVDCLVPWYCQAKLSECPHVVFHTNEYDDSFAVFNLYGKTYLCAHGDLDSDLKLSTLRIGEMLGKQIDYFFVGHLHVPDMRLEQTGFIRNGAVVSGGDEYTSKKRLYAPAYQVCMTVNRNGVESVRPVRLS